MLDCINVSLALVTEVYRVMPNFNKTFLLNFFFFYFSSKNLKLMDFAENGKKREQKTWLKNRPIQKKKCLMPAGLVQEINNSSRFMLNQLIHDIYLIYFSKTPSLLANWETEPAPPTFLSNSSCKTFMVLALSCMISLIFL